ncbi:MAG: DUF1214 domain-containing protein, partial [Myxococcales bacterium]|nr:DUF1214 domain-containing protein [Myxococcales bacterium]
MSDELSKQEREILDGAVWNQFCDTLKMAGNVVLGPNTPSDPLNRMEGFRYLSRITRAALQTFVEHNDPLAPVLQRVVHETAKMGADHPDNYYQNAAISGDHEYRIWGNRGTVHYLGFFTQKGNYGQGRGMPPTGYLEASTLDVASDGSFEIILSTKEQPGNWLPMEKDTGTLIVRQTRLDGENETIADLHIERLGGDGMATPFDPIRCAEGLTQSAGLVAGAAMLFASWAEGFKKHTNQLPRFDQNVSNMAGGVPDIAYYHSYWKLAPDEALVIDATPPDCEHWNFQLNNCWMESLDYRYYPVHVNKHTAKYRPDGSVRVVVAAQDKGFDNWIDTVGHEEGTMCWRWVRATEHPQ